MAGESAQFLAQGVDDHGQVDVHVSTAIQRFNGHHAVIMLICCGVCVCVLQLLLVWCRGIAQKVSQPAKLSTMVGRLLVISLSRKEHLRPVTLTPSLRTNALTALQGNQSSATHHCLQGSPAFVPLSLVDDDEIGWRW